jgi:hypothetical protein
VEILLDPLRERIAALRDLARAAHGAVAAAPTVRGRPLVDESWEITYAKICWRCIQAEFGNAKACGLSADPDGQFVFFIRALATFASGKTVETVDPLRGRHEVGFGGAVKEALAWGKKMARLESWARKFLETGERSEEASWSNEIPVTN